MRYILTKDGKIIDVKKLLPRKNKPDVTDDETRLIVCIENKDFDCYGWKRRVSKIADSIKELCDCYALEDCVDPIRGLFLFKSFTFAKREAEKRNERLFGYVIIEKKGAKALEPVAVLNEKGEMELL